MSRQDVTPSSNWKALQKTLPPTSKYTRKRKRTQENEIESVEDLPTSQKPAQALPTPSSGSADAGRYVALDCEFVGVGMAGIDSMLARVSIVNYHGHTLLDTFVEPKERVTDYRTWVSGVTAADLRGEGTRPVASFEHVQKEVAKVLSGRILVGHAVHNDLKCLLLSHPRVDIRDTASYPPLQEMAKTKRPSLRKLAQLVLGVEIQGDLEGGHSSVEDAIATMNIFRAHKAAWDATLRLPRAANPERQDGGKRSAHDGYRRQQVKHKRTLGVAASLQHARNIEDTIREEIMAPYADSGEAAPKKATRRPSKANQGEWWKTL